MKTIYVTIALLTAFCLGTTAQQSDNDAWQNAQWIALQQDSAKIVPGVHIPLVKKTFGQNKPGMYRMPLFQKTFKNKKNVQSATMTICGLGQFEAYVNGTKVGNHFLDPGWTMYDKEAEYVNFDVNSMLRKGDNVIDVWLGNGFYNIPRERYAKLIQSYGAPKLKANLHLLYKNGKTLDIPTDLSWRVKGSPITYSSIYGGESYDARLETNSDWQTPVLATQNITLKEQIQPVTYHDVLQPVKITVLKQNINVYDFGQNCAGIPRITVKGKPGDKVKLIPGELKKADGSAWNSVASKHFYEYTLADTLEHTWQPRFSYFGFRYLQVEKSAPDMQCEKVELVTTYADMKEVGYFHSSDTMLNKIHSLIDWAIKSNSQSISHDCPTREKLGWLEQTYLMQESMMYRYDMRRLFQKTMSEMAASQHEDGCVPTIAPEYVVFGDAFGDTPEWGSAFIIVPWRYYEWYGDDSLIRTYYDRMVKYLDYLTSKREVIDGHNVLAYGLGDWYDIGPKHPGYSQLTTNGVTATATYYYNTTLLGRMARLIGKQEDSKHFASLAEEIKKTYNEAYLKHTTDSCLAHYDRNSETANAISLCMNLVPDSLRPSVEKSLVGNILKDGNTAGDIGFRYVLEALTNSGQDSLIYALATDDTKPSYAYQIKQGATALTESWQALPTVSNDHLMLGHLMQWFYGGVGGIRQAEGSTGWNHIIINPRMFRKDFSCTCSLDTPHGLVRCEYVVSSLSPLKYSLKVDIPEGADGTIILPDGTTKTLSCGHHEL